MPCSQLAERPNANPASSRRPTANQLQAFRFDLAPAADRRKLFSKVVSAAVSAERARRVKFNQYAHSTSIYICALPRERAHSGSGLSVNFLLFFCQLIHLTWRRRTGIVSPNKPAWRLCANHATLTNTLATPQLCSRTHSHMEAAWKPSDNIVQIKYTKSTRGKLECIECTDTFLRLCVCVCLCASAAYANIFMA